jgi:hypothetical protein
MSRESDMASQVEDILDLSPRRRQRGRFTVVCPVYNRRRTLQQALDSLLAQTYKDWLCLILDDGSTDGTSHISTDYARQDPRFLYVRFEENRGGVVMNEIGMRVACELGEYWSRLGSDDWFEPHKLMVDYVTLGRNELPACFGPYQCKRKSFLEGILCSQRIDALRKSRRLARSWANAAVRIGVLRKVPARFDGSRDVLHSPPVDARGELLSSRFAMSWANAAVRSEVLRKVRDRFGGFCDLHSRNMEDFHCNVRIASVSSIVWRGLKKDMKTVVIGAQTWAEAGDESEFLHDGFWRVASDGASNKREQVAFDTRITLAAIQEDLSEHPPEKFPAVRPRVVCL